MNTEIVTVTYKTCQQVSPDDWVTYNDVFHFGTENTLEEVIRALRARHYTDKHGETHAEIHFSAERTGQ